MPADRRKMYVRLPADLTSALESLRFRRSQELGRRVSLRELVEQLLTKALSAGTE